MKTITTADLEQTQRVHGRALDLFQRPRDSLFAVALAARVGPQIVLAELAAEAHRAAGAWGSAPRFREHVQDRLCRPLSDSRPMDGPNARPPSRNRRRGW